MNIDEMKSKLKESLSKERYIHSIRVMELSENLALHYKIDVNKAKIAGLLHDCAKNISRYEEYALLNKYGIVLDEIQKQSHSLIHSILGLYVAKEKYFITDEEILEAIYWHTTGRAGMTMLEKVVFIADYIEPGRTFDIAKKVREHVYNDIDRCILLCTEATILYLIGNKRLVHPYTMETRNDALLTIARRNDEGAAKN